MSSQKKRGRKPVEEYYKNKKADNVEIEEVYMIQLPISIEEYNHNPGVDRETEILLDNPSVLTPFSFDKDDYSVVLDSLDYVKKVGKTPIFSEVVVEHGETSKKETYDISLLKTYKESTLIKSEVACWWCCHNFDGLVIHLPCSLKHGIYSCNGVFCSYACCYSYMKCDKTYSKNMHLLNYMFKEQTGKKGTILQHIKPAPPRETLELLGGPLTIEEFRKNSSVVIVNRIPFIYKPSQMQKFTKIVKPEEKIFKILPPCKKYKPVKQILANNSLGKMLGISIVN